MNRSQTRAPWMPMLSGCARSWRPIRIHRVISSPFTASDIGLCREFGGGSAFHLFLLQFFLCHPHSTASKREKLEQVSNADSRLNPVFLAEVHLAIGLAGRRRHSRCSKY